MPRDVAFFDQLIEWLELERSAQRARYEEQRAQLSLGELEAKGLVVLDLEPVEEAIGLGGRFLVSMERADRQGFAARLHNGDLVMVRPRRAEDMEAARGIISRATRNRIQVAFDRAPPAFVGEGRLRIDIVPNDVTFDRARQAVLAIQQMDQGQARRRREVLLGNEAPRMSKPLAFEASRPLNPEQRDAAACALGAEDFFLVHGPPGTGKSTVLAEIAVQAVRSGARLVATAASNAAVDHLLELCLAAGLSALRVGHPARVSPHLVEHTLDVVVEDNPDRQIARDLFDEAFELQGYARKQRRQGRSRDRFSNARESSIEARRLIEEARALEKKAVRSVLDRAQVICATCASLDSGPLAGEHFDLALLDEATQAIEPIALIAFLKAPRVILAGDHRQLPPTVLSPQAAQRGLSRSLFERLLEDHGDGIKRILLEQYRMNNEIMSFPSEEMYAGALRAHPSVAGRTLLDVLTPGVGLDVPPVLFLDTAGKGFDEAVQPGSESYFNEGEASLITDRVRELMSSGLVASELAVIAPYSAQAGKLRELVEDPRVEVDTIDAFQGREKDAILLSMTRSNAEGSLGFLTDLRRMNVALTRARRHLFVVGDSATLGGHPFYARFIESLQRRGGYRSAWEWPAPGA